MSDRTTKMYDNKDIVSDILGKLTEHKIQVY